MERRPCLRPVRVHTNDGAPVGPRAAAPADVALTALLFLVGLLPLAGRLAGVGRWGEGSVGFGTAVVLLAGRELWHEILDAYRAR